MSRTSRTVFCFLVLSSIVVSQGTAQQKLRVSTKRAEPFSIYEEGRWRGLSIELWERIAGNLDLEYEYVEQTIPEMLKSVEQGNSDIAVAALTVTHRREETLDFTHSVMSTGLGIATKTGESGGVLSVMGRLFSTEFLSATLGLLLLIGVVGVALWLFERRKNKEEFGGTIQHGIGAGMWWSAVTMTTVGYGDKSPRSLPGRLVALVWMFASIILISTFTAAIASSLTVSQLEGTIQGPEDLPGARIGTVPGTTSAQWLDKNLYRAREYDTVRDAMKALEAGKLDAVVYDAPILEYLANREVSGVHVLPHRLVRQDYAFAVQKGADLRKLVNTELLKILSSDVWEQLNRKYFGGA